MATTRFSFNTRAKLHAAFAAVTLLVFLFSVGAIYLQIVTAERAAIQEAEHVANSIAITGVEDPLRNPALLQQHVSKLYRFYKRDLFIVDASKRVIADADREGLGRIFSDDPGGPIAKTISDGQTRTFIEATASGDRRQVVVPFRTDQANEASMIVGAVVFEYTQIFQKLMDDARPKIYLMGALGFFFVGVIALLGIRVVAAVCRPLEGLERGVRRLAGGDFSAEVVARGDDEVGSLGRAFNRMAGELRTSHAKLLQNQSDLESRVAQRTSELTEANLRLLDEVAERKKAEEQLAYLAKFDGVTGLPNRHMFYDRLSQALAQAKRLSAPLACMFVDLDRFKAINDTYGHSVGDLLLGQFGERLKQCVRSRDTVARLGGDEFAVLLETLAKPTDADVVAQKVLDAVAKPFDLAGRESYVGASIGISLYPQHDDDITPLLQKADVAMYVAKQQGRNNFKHYSSEMDRNTALRMALETSLRGALERDEFLLHYQPKASLVDGTMTGLEALVRWQDSKRGLVSPAQFIPILEESGLIVPVGEWIIDAVCRQISSWQAQGIAVRPVAVNLSARQFKQRELAQAVRATLDRHNVDPSLIQFEITESMLMDDPNAALRVMQDLKSAAIRLSVDDFGTGYSSLAYLKRFPLDELKIDRTFVNDVASDTGNASIILAVINLAHNLKLKVVAEGVENRMQMMFLKTHGCNEMQGYYFARPMGVEQCTQALAQGQRLDIPAENQQTESPVLLLLDDNESDLQLMQRALKPGGYKIVSTMDPYEALQILMERNVSIVISDHNMPRLSGTDFMVSVRNLYPDTLRIVMSGSTSLDVVASAVNAAAVHKFLSKNWNAARLLAEVRDAYSRRTAGAISPS